MYAKNKLLTALSVLITTFVVIAVSFYLYKEACYRFLFASKYFVPSNKPKMLVVWRHGLGERELGERIMRVAPQIGCNVRFVAAKFDKTTRSIFDQYILDQPAYAAQIMQPDFILIIDRAVAPIAGYQNYVVLDQRMETYIHQVNGKNQFINPNHYLFTGLFPTFKEINVLKETFEQSGKPYVGFNWRPTVHRTKYKPKEPKRLFFPGGALSDPTRSSEKYKKVYKMLAQAGYFDVYGWEDRLAFLGEAYKGYIPIDGESILKINNDAGISLILHADEHLRSGTPTGRIFESSAANTVIISDQHSFVQEHFGDNVLYIDVDLSAEEMFQQIDTHMQWIKSHPHEAKQMAANCHKIFLEKFTLEDLLGRVISLAMYNKANHKP